MSRHVHASLYARVSFHTAASMMALQNALEGSGSAGRAGLNPAFENLPEKQKRTRLNALLVFPGLTAPGWRLPRVLGYSIPAFLAGVRGGWRIPVWPGSSFLIDRSGGRMVLF